MKEQVKSNWNFWLFLLLTPFTLGIYGIWFLWRMMDQFNMICEAEDEGPYAPHGLIFILLSILTLGVYAHIWFYKQGDRLKAVGRKYNVAIKQDGFLYLKWSLLSYLTFGVGGLVAWYLFLQNVNRLAKVYNKKYNFVNRKKTTQHKEVKKKEDVVQRKQVEYNEDTIISTAEGIISFIQGEHEGKSVSLKDKKPILLGRNSQECGIVFSDRDISRRHCIVQYNPEDHYYYIRDISSVGTVINNSQRLIKDKVTRCSAGTIVSIGKGTNVFVLK